jgi:hypothetical protein
LNILYEGLLKLKQDFLLTFEIQFKKKYNMKQNKDFSVGLDTYNPKNYVKLFLSKQYGLLSKYFRYFSQTLSLLIYLLFLKMENYKVEDLQIYFTMIRKSKLSKN